jgi:hypothetical protein
MLKRDLRETAFRMVWDHLGRFRIPDVPVLFPDFQAPPQRMRLSSSGWRSNSSTFRGNLGNSSKRRYRSGFRSRFLLGLESRSGPCSFRDPVTCYSWQPQALKGFEGLPLPDTRRVFSMQ